MTQFVEKNRKKLFVLVPILTYVCIFAYIFLTPYLSDDFAYMMEMRDTGAKTVGDVARLAFDEYFLHGGRLVHYFTFRIFLFIPTKMVFNIVASAIFVVLGLLIYANISKKKKYDIGVIMLIYLMIWLFCVRPGQTVVWLTGSVVYLFATTYILGSLTLFRYMMSHEKVNHPIIISICLFLLCLIAGNVSENNSGAAILLLVIFTINKYVDDKKNFSATFTLKKFVKPYMIVAFVGYIAGFLTLVLSPGAHVRASSAAVNDYKGIVGLLSHFYKISVSLRDLFLPMFIVIAILFVILAIKGQFKSFKDVRTNTAVLYLIAVFAGSYALIVIPLPELRAFFGASVFLILVMVELLQLTITMIQDNEKSQIMFVVKYSAIAIFCMIFFFTYLENLVNLARIYREKNEQFSILEDAVANGNTSYVEIPQLHEPFDNKYTIAYYPQLDEDPSFWLNTFYEGWFGIDEISAIPRDIWDENH